MEETEDLHKSITEKGSSYKRWIASEGIPIIEGSYQNIREVPLEPGSARGDWRPVFAWRAPVETNDAYICEIPPGKALSHRNICSKSWSPHIVSGRGATTVWNDGEPKHTFEWQEGSVSSPPLNSWHQHFNGNGAEPARYLAVTTAPCMINLIHSIDFIFNCDYVFRDRFDSQTGLF